MGSNFLEGIKFDVDNKERLIDPRVCQGKQVIPNVLQYLGVDCSIADNPQVINVFRSLFEGVDFDDPKKTLDLLQRMKEDGHLKINLQTGELDFYNEGLAYERFVFKKIDGKKEITASYVKQNRPKPTDNFYINSDSLIDEYGIIKKTSEFAFQNGFLKKRIDTTRDTNNPFVLESVTYDSKSRDFSNSTGMYSKRCGTAGEGIHGSVGTVRDGLKIGKGCVRKDFDGADNLSHYGTPKERLEMLKASATLVDGKLPNKKILEGLMKMAKTAGIEVEDERSLNA